MSTRALVTFRFKQLLSFYPLLLFIFLSAFHLFKIHYTSLLYFEAEYYASNMGVAQVFWDVGDGFNQNDSVAASIRNGDEVKAIKFHLPEETILGIRFDPNTTTGQVTINDIAIKNGRGDVVIPISSQELKWVSGIQPLSGENDMDYSLTNSDPIFVLDIDYSRLAEYQSRLVWPSMVKWVGLAALFVYGGYFLFGSLIIPIVLAYISWSLFSPGILTPDSIDQYWQATNNHFWNWHPPLMAILLQFFLNVGLSIGQIILIQTMFFFVGIHVLCDLLFRLLSRFLQIRLGHTSRIFLILLVFLCLLSPITPFAAFASTLWKDVWFAILFLWIVSISLILYEYSDKLKWQKIVLWTLLGGLMILSVSFRHNAILLIPFYLIILWMLSKGVNLSVRFIAVAFVLYSFFGLNTLVFSKFNIHKLEPKQSIMGLELVGLIVLYPEMIDELPYTKSQLKDHYLTSFDWAAYDYQRWGDDPYMKPDFVRTDENKPLKHEYLHALKHHPFRLIRVKLYNYARLIDPRTTTEWCPRGIHENEFGIEVNSLFKSIRSRYERGSNYIYYHPFWRYLSSVHLVWIVGSLLLLLRVCWSFMKHRFHQSLFYTLLALFPLVYSFSYVLAIPWTAFRYIYPSTLLVQVFYICLGLCFLLKLTQKYFGFGSTAD